MFTDWATGQHCLTLVQAGPILYKSSIVNNIEFVLYYVHLHMNMLVKPTFSIPVTRQSDYLPRLTHDYFVHQLVVSILNSRLLTT